MLQLLAPAGSPEAVIAAVQSGADMIYIGYGVTDGGRGEHGFAPDGSTQEDFVQSIRYCRIRGCGVAVAVNGLYTDETLPAAVQWAMDAAKQGAEALLVRDVGLISVLRTVLPDTPLWGDVRMDIHSLDNAMAAAALGLKRIFLPPELTLEQIRDIAQHAPLQTAVCVHGPVCFAHSGQCYMSVFSDRRRSDSVLRCTAPCRGQFSLGGRMDDHPMLMADICLMDHLTQLEEAGVDCAVISGQGRRPEYVAYITGLYARALGEGVLPTQEEYDWLRQAFSSGALTDGYFTGERGPAMQAHGITPGRETEKLMADVRKGYMIGERRRVPVTFYAVLRQGQAAMFAAEDRRGHRAVYQGFVPADLGRQGLTEGRVREIMYRTGGTPYSCEEVHCSLDPHLDYPDEALEEARRALLSQITDAGREAAPVTAGAMPEKPDAPPRLEETKFILQVSREEQLTEDLAMTEPDYLYVPAELLAAGSAAVNLFRQRGTELVAVLPRVVTDPESPVLRELLATLSAMGIRQALAGGLGLIPAALQAGISLRGDYGLNVTNSWTQQRLMQAGLLSVTASFELSARQLRELAQTADTEMIVYGRMPVMVTDQCLIRSSTGRCSCSTPTSMSDPFGSVYPVEKEFGCRNVIYDGRKIFLADRPDVYQSRGLWGARLLFTTESPRECAAVAQRYRGQNNYRPNNIGRGLYPKGAL